jgi:hypothetical protein
MTVRPSIQTQATRHHNHHYHRPYPNQQPDSTTNSPKRKLPELPNQPTRHTPPSARQAHPHATRHTAVAVTQPRLALPYICNAAHLIPSPRSLRPRVSPSRALILIRDAAIQRARRSAPRVPLPRILWRGVRRCWVLYAAVRAAGRWPMWVGRGMG